MFNFLAEVKTHMLLASTPRSLLDGLFKFGEELCIKKVLRACFGTCMCLSSSWNSCTRAFSSGVKITSGEAFEDDMTGSPPGKALLTEDTEPVDPNNVQVTDKERQKAIAMLYELHKASGHAGNKAFARRCRDRSKLPGWVIQEAERLVCQACVEAERGGQNVIHKSLGEQPQPWRFVGVDVLELALPKQQKKSFSASDMPFHAGLWTGPIS